MTRTATATAMRSSLRRWRKELIYTAVVAGFCFPFRGGATGFAVMMGFSFGLWWMGFSHRHLPLAEAIHKTYETVQELKAAEPAAAKPRPKLSVVPRV